MNEVNGALEVNYTEEIPFVTEWYNDVTDTIKKEDPKNLIALSMTGDLFWDKKGNYLPWRGLMESKNTDIIQIHAYGFEAEDYDKYFGQLETMLKDALQYKKPVMLGEFNIAKKNPLRYKHMERTFKLTNSLKIPALIWTHRYDHLGELDDKTIKVIKKAHGN